MAAATQIISSRNNGLDLIIRYYLFLI